MSKRSRQYISSERKVFFCFLGGEKGGAGGGGGGYSMLLARKLKKYIFVHRLFQPK